MSYSSLANFIDTLGFLGQCDVSLRWSRNEHCFVCFVSSKPAAKVHVLFKVLAIRCIVCYWLLPDSRCQNLSELVQSNADCVEQLMCSLSSECYLFVHFVHFVLPCFFRDGASEFKPLPKGPRWKVEPDSQVMSSPRSPRRPSFRVSTCSDMPGTCPWLQRKLHCVESKIPSANAWKKIGHIWVIMSSSRRLQR